MSTTTTNNNNNKRSSIIGIDKLLQLHGKKLKTGEKLRLRLIKGPNGTITGDPVDGQAPYQAFPLVAKFPESVVKPEFNIKNNDDGGSNNSNAKHSTARLYQQDIPKPLEDSDEEVDAQDKNKPRKRWRQYDNIKPRQWILQEQVDFLETMVSRRQHQPINSKKVSSRYEGIPEHNSSQYVLFRLNRSDNANDSAEEQQQDGQLPSIQLLNLPMNSTITFAQPAARKTLSLTQAEHVIEDQRMGIRTMHNVHTEDVVEPKATNQPLRIPPSKKSNTSKSRLLGKLQAQAKKQAAVDGDEGDEGDDVMGDVTFRNRKGGGGSSAARKELLTTLGDSDLAVSQDGVLGGSNDAAFGMGQRFGNLQTDKLNKGSGKKGGGGEDDGDDDNHRPGEGTKGGVGGGGDERGADGAAMADDFYQRDVKAEYDELDYDAAEQFDDDDVDMAEAEVHVDPSGGYGLEGEEDDAVDPEEFEEEVVGGAEGLASVAGFKMMLARARGELPMVPPPGTEAAGGDGGPTVPGANKDKIEKNKESDVNDHFAKVMAAAAAAPAAPAAAAIQTDENGLRIITLAAVQNEIWLNHGSVPMKRLMKIFEIKKKSAPERQNKFREVVKELCTMKNDPIDGRMLVLKQHYSSNMV